MVDAEGGESEPYTVDAEGGTNLDVYVQPGASRSEVVGRYGAAVKVRVAAPPDRGRANAALEALLAGELGVRRRDVTVVSGQAARNKCVRVDGVEPDRLRSWYRALGQA